MSVENTAFLEAQGEGEHISKESAEQKLLSISDIQSYINTLSQNADPEIQDRLQNADLQSEVLRFISDATQGKLGDSLGEFSGTAFDTDGETGLDAFEFDLFVKSLQGAIEQIVMLDGIEAFEEAHNDAAYTGWMSPDKAVAKSVDLQEMILGDESGGSFMEGVLNSAGISDEALQTMSEKTFDPTNSENWKEMAILLSKELGEGVEDILRFLGNSPAGALLIPRYLTYRAQINFEDPAEATQAEIKLQEMVKENPSLAILDLLGEKGMDMLQQLASMFVSGKQGDIAMVLVSIAGLLAGGAGALKVGARAAKLGRLENIAAKVQAGAERVDDIVGGAGIGHMTGAFSNTEPVLQTSEIPANSNFSPDAKLQRMEIPEEILATGTDGIGVQRFNSAEMIENAKLSDTDRLRKASQELGIIFGENSDLGKGLIEAHNYGAGGEGVYTLRELAVKRQILMNAGLSKEQATKLMDLGLAGEAGRLRNLTPSDILKVGDSVNYRASDGNIYPGIVVGWDSQGYILQVSDSQSVNVHPNHILVEEKTVDPWTVSQELPRVDVSPLRQEILNISGQGEQDFLLPLLKKLDTGDFTTQTGRQKFLDEISESTNNRITILSGKLRNTEQALEEIEVTIQRLTNKLEETKEKLTREKERVGAINDQLGTQKSRIDSLTKAFGEREKGSLDYMRGLGYETLRLKPELVTAFNSLPDKYRTHFGDALKTSDEKIKTLQSEKYRFGKMETPEAYANSVLQMKKDGVVSNMRTRFTQDGNFIHDTFGPLTTQEIRALTFDDFANIAEKMRIKLSTDSTIRTSYSREHIAQVENAISYFNTQIEEMRGINAGKTDILKKAMEEYSPNYNEQVAKRDARLPEIERELETEQGYKSALETIMGESPETQNALTMSNGDISRYEQLVSQEAYVSTELSDANHELSRLEVEKNDGNEKIRALQGEITFLSDEQGIKNGIKWKNIDEIKGLEGWIKYYSVLPAKVTNMLSL